MRKSTFNQKLGASLLFLSIITYIFTGVFYIMDIVSVKSLVFGAVIILYNLIVGIWIFEVHSNISIRWADFGIDTIN
jgi:hypothetical protein